MLGLPQRTELNKRINKSVIYNVFNLESKQKDAFDADISLLYIVNEISEQSAGISKGDEVSAIHVIRVVMKKKEYNDANITRLFKLIDNKIILLLEHEDEGQIVAHHSKLFKSDWLPIENLVVSLKGLTLDAVYESIITQIGGFQIESGNTLEEQIALDEKQLKLQKEIDRLTKLARKEKQPKKKFEFVQRINKLNKELEEFR